MSSLFKTRYLPNADGSESATALTDANTVFVHTYLGDDNTGDGTRAKPYRSATKAMLKGVTYMVFRGVLNEAFSTSKQVLGDDINQTIIQANFAPNFNYAYRLTSDRVIPRLYATTPTAWLLNITNASTAIGGGAGYRNPQYMNCLFKNLVIASVENGYDFSTNGNNTFNSFYITSNSSGIGWAFYKSIFINKFNIVTTYIVFKYNVFTTETIFAFNGVNIIQPNWVSDSKANVALLRAAYISAGMTSTNALLTFPQDSFGNETCLVIKQSKDGGTSPNVFNKYDITLTGTITSAITANQAKTSIQLTVADSSKFPATGDIFVPNTAGDGSEVFTYTSVTINSGTLITFNGASYTFKVAHTNGATCTRYGDVLDFTLNPDPLNEALWASDTGGYVGCFRPAVDGIINVANPIIDVNTDGTDTANAGTLMLVDSSGNLVFNYSSVQTWNRMRDQNTISIPIGSNFKGLSAMSQDGSPFGYYLGKKQNLIDTTVVNAGDALTIGQMYKVFNNSAQDVTKSVVYNGVQYLPEFTFMCLASPTTFSLLNAGSGTYLKKVTADVLESIEILPYDDATTPSAFPKFSAPLMGECKLLYYTAAGATRYGKTTGNPVLFGDISAIGQSTTLSAGISGSPTSIPLTSTTGFPTFGTVLIGATPYIYTSISGNNLLGAAQATGTITSGTSVSFVTPITDFGTINNKDSIYNDYAISNADQEFFTLANPSLSSPKNTYFKAAIPVLRYLRREINGHFDQPYDY